MPCRVPLTPTTLAAKGRWQPWSTSISVKTYTSHLRWCSCEVRVLLHGCLPVATAADGVTAASALGQCGQEHRHVTMQACAYTKVELNIEGMPAHWCTACTARA
eukprot:14631196-Alexandrium_andersonii.AAC.1